MKHRVLILREQPLLGQHGRIKNFAVLCLWFLESTYVVNSWAPEFIWGHDIFRTWRWAKPGGTLWNWLSSWDVDGLSYVLSFPLFSRPLFTRIVSMCVTCSPVRFVWRSSCETVLGWPWCWCTEECAWLWHTHCLFPVSLEKMSQQGLTCAWHLLDCVSSCGVSVWGGCSKKAACFSWPPS